MSAFLQTSIATELEKLRAICAVKREIKRNAFGRRWARSARSNAENERDCGPSDKYWDDRQAEAQRQAVAELEAADKALADFIAEHRPLMSDEWIGNDHGRLCWAPFRGGLPCGQHYCQLEEGHDGHHCNNLGSWPQGVTNDHEWHQLKAKELVPVNMLEE